MASCVVRVREALTRLPRAEHTLPAVDALDGVLGRPAGPSTTTAPRSTRRWTRCSSPSPTSTSQSSTPSSGRADDTGPGRVRPTAWALRRGRRARTARCGRSWSDLGVSLADVRPGELLERQRQTDRLLDAEGAGHLVHELTFERTAAGRRARRRRTGASRPWRLDPVPLVLGHDDFEQLAAGATQRMRAARGGARRPGRRAARACAAALCRRRSPTGRRRCCSRCRRVDGSCTTRSMSPGRRAGEWRVVQDLVDSPDGPGLRAAEPIGHRPGDARRRASVGRGADRFVRRGPAARHHRAIACQVVAARAPSCSAAGRRTSPTSSTRTSRRRWASTSPRAATWSCARTGSGCARSTGSSRSTSSTAASKTERSIRWSAGRPGRPAFPASRGRRRPAVSRWRTRSARTCSSRPTLRRAVAGVSSVTLLGETLQLAQLDPTEQLASTPVYAGARTDSLAPGRVVLPSAAGGLARRHHRHAWRRRPRAGGRRSRPRRPTAMLAKDVWVVGGPPVTAPAACHAPSAGRLRIVGPEAGRRSAVLDGPCRRARRGDGAHDPRDRRSGAAGPVARRPGHRGVVAGRAVHAARRAGAESARGR